MDCKKLSESKGRIWVSVRLRKSRSFEATISARSGPSFLTDLEFSTPSMRGPGLGNTFPSSSNNKSPLLLTMVENFRQERIIKFFLQFRSKEDMMCWTI